MIPSKSMMPLKSRTAAFAAIVMVVAFAALAARTVAQDAGRPPRADSAGAERWRAGARGRGEPSAGEIKIGAPVMGVIAEVLVKVNDKVFVGEPLIRLVDNEAQARLATAEAQVALRKRSRNDETAPIRAAARRRAEDAVGDADKAIVEAQAGLDKAAVERRAGRASDADLEAARTGLARARDRP